MRFGHGLFDHADRVRPLRARVQTHARNERGDLLPELLQLMAALLLADLELAFAQDGQDDLVDVGRAKSFLELRSGRGRTFGDVGKDLGDLQDLGQVGLVPLAVLFDFVLVAGDLEPFACFL